ncbi:MAG TPA: hypothetical protein DCM49_03415 [Lachnospiraceae bacterium]|nr:hypothetical protein [Lachnospiraceae bacterium]
MIRIKNLTDDINHVIIETKGNFSVLEHKRDSSVNPESARLEYYMKEMNIHKRQLIIDLEEGEGVVIQAGSMQWVAGDVEATTGVRGPLDFLGKFVKGSMTDESAIKPEYVGEGSMALEPTFKHILLEEVEDWDGGLVMEDGMFLACDSTVKRTVQMRSNVSSAVLGHEGMFNTKLTGAGVAALESNVPREELVIVEMKDDVLKVDGSYAVCWSGSLKFSVGKAGKTLAGSIVSKEKLVNIYSGTGRVMLSTVANSYADAIPPETPKQEQRPQPKKEQKGQARK